MTATYTKLSEAARELFARIAEVGQNNTQPIDKRSISPSDDPLTFPTGGAADNKMFVTLRNTSNAFLRQEITHDSVVFQLAVAPMYGTERDSIILTVASEAARKDNERYGLRRPDGVVPTVILYKTDGVNHIKSLLARELDRSGIPELQDVGRQFLAELKGETPVPPLSGIAHVHYTRMKMVL